MLIDFKSLTTYLLTFYSITKSQPYHLQYFIMFSYKQLRDKGARWNALPNVNLIHLKLHANNELVKNTGE